MEMEKQLTCASGGESQSVDQPEGSPSFSSTTTLEPAGPDQSGSQADRNFGKGLNFFLFLSTPE